MRLSMSLALLALAVVLAGCQAVSQVSTPETGQQGGVPQPSPTRQIEAPPTATIAPPTFTPVSTSTPQPSPTRQTETPPTATIAPSATLPSTDTPQPTAISFAPRVEVVATGLEVPWALAFASDGRLFITERPGRLRVMEKGMLRQEPVALLPVAAVGEGGLMGLVLDPAFDQNGYLYVMYTYQVGGGVRNRIARLTITGNQAGDEFVLLDNIPGGSIHDGGRLLIGPDNMLYATTGETGQRDLAQDLNSLAGKVLRIRLDGSIPDDNPFPGSPIYTYGHRNPEGIDWYRDSGQLFLSEHGPTGEMGLCCRDEINRLVPGANYGWPIVTGAPGDKRFMDPILFSGMEVTWAPAGLAIYQGEPLAPWQDNLFFAALRGRHLHRVVLSADRTQVIAEERLFEEQYGRLRAVLVGPDGYLYFTTSNRDGRGSPSRDDDRILRIVPAS